MGWEAVWRPNTCVWGPNWCTKVGDGGYCSFSVVLRCFLCLKNVPEAQDSAFTQQHPGIEGDRGAWDGW